jgi:hypothetical protein
MSFMPAATKFGNFMLLAKAANLQQLGENLPWNCPPLARAKNAPLFVSA